MKKGWIFWTPRIVSIIFIAFLALFSLDVFGNDYGFWGTLVAFLMHNIPVLILAIVVWISWKKHEWLAGSIFILGGLLYIFVTLRTAIINGFEWYYLSWIVQISGIAFFIGILFLIGWKRKLNKRRK
jgi:hypothetical protein